MGGRALEIVDRKGGGWGVLRDRQFGGRPALFGRRVMVCLHSPAMGLGAKGDFTAWNGAIGLRLVAQVLNGFLNQGSS